MKTFLGNMLQDSTKEEALVVFLKRTNDGELREMRCVAIPEEAFEAVVGPHYVPSQYGLVLVKDLDLNEIRTVPEEGIITLTINGVTYDKSSSPEEVSELQEAVQTV